MSTIIGITPGGLGIVEWVWTGALNFLGFDSVTAGKYALFNRVIVVMSQLVIFIGLSWVMLLNRDKQRAHEKEPE